MNANRMCTKMTTLAAAAVFCFATAVAQQPSSGGSGMGGSTGAAAGSAGQNDPMHSGMDQMQGMKQSGMGKNGMSSMQDTTFLKKAAAGNLAEVAAAKVALEKSSNDQVKQYAQRLIDDHSKMQDQLKPVAEKLNVTLPSQPMPKAQAMMTKMQGMSGDSFDKAYIKDMVKDHTEDLKDFKKEASMGKDQDVKNLAQQGSTVIQSHLDEAQKLAQSMGVMSGGKMSGNSGQ